MLQDIAPHKLANEFIPGVTAQPYSPVFHFKGSDFLVKVQDGVLRLPTAQELPDTATLQYLFTMDEMAFFACLDEELEAPEEYSYRGLRAVRSENPEPRHLFFAAYTAYQLSSWCTDNRYCGRCGHTTVPAPDERAIDCPDCGRRIYPRIQPAVIVGVTKGDELVVTRYANRPSVSWALVAGFNEIGETLEETVKREVMEEIGLEVDNIRYYKSQPWGIASDILSGFYCDVVGDPTIKLHDGELKEAFWVKRPDIVGQPDDFSLTNEMMIVFRNGGEPK